MQYRLSRRRFVGLTCAAGALAVLPQISRVSSRQGRPHAAESIGAGGWSDVDLIRARIESPVFPPRDFDITRGGAVGDGTTLCTQAFREVINACSAAGGGRVVVPPGRYVTGPIRLKTGVNLHLSEGATILFSRQPRHYLPPVLTRWEGIELMGYSPFIYAVDQRRIAVTGRGVLDGQADEANWWPWAAGGGLAHDIRRKIARWRLKRMAAEGIPVSERIFGDGSCLRPSLLQPYRCRDVLFEGVTIVNSPMWVIHPVLCENVTVRGVTVDSRGPNNDGCNPEACRDVLIEGCTFRTGNDCIALKSGRDEDGRRLGTPVENVIIRDCFMDQGHGAIAVGSEISGGARNVFVERCRMGGPLLDHAIHIKTNSVRGGRVEQIYARDVSIGEIAGEVLAVTFHYEEADAGIHPPIVRGIELRNFTSEMSKAVLSLRGYAHSPIHDVSLRDCAFDVKEPDFVVHATRLTFDNVRVNGSLVMS